MKNVILTSLLLGALGFVMGTFGKMIGGGEGEYVAIGAAFFVCGYLWFCSDRIALKDHKARLPNIDNRRHREAEHIIQDIASRAGIPTPRFYVFKSRVPNAFSAGRNHQNAVIALSDGLLRLLTLPELTGVIAHEIAHIRNRDSQTITIAAIMADSIIAMGALLSLVGLSIRKGGGIVVTAILGIFIALILRVLLGRRMEYQADADAAALCGSPQWLADALRKLGGLPASDSMPEHAAMASLYFHCHIPHGWLAWLLDTHPSIESRIERLELIPARRT